MRTYVDDYTHYLDDFFFLASHFERINGVEQHTYTNGIDQIDRQRWADQVVKDEILRLRWNNGAIRVPLKR